jgi:hypothetical protein
MTTDHERRFFIPGTFLTLGAVLFVWGLAMLLHGLNSNANFEYRAPEIMASIGLLPTSGILLLAAAHLWVHQDK